MAGHATFNPAEHPPGFLNEYSGTQLIATAVLFIVLDSLAFFTRLIYRFKTKATWGIDDTLLIPGYIFNVALCAFCANMVNWAGVGTHLVKNLMVDPSRLSREFKGLLVIEWLYALAVIFPKLAILQLYLRIFPNKWFRISMHVTTALVVATCIQTLFGALFQCTPVSFIWDKTIPGGFCIDQNALYRWTTFPNILTDILIVVLPIPLVVKLRVSADKRRELLCVFIFGGAGLIFSIVRFILFFGAEAFTDVTWSSSILLTITCVEPGVYFLCACVPGFQYLFHSLKKLTPWGSSGPTTRGYGAGYGSSHAEKSARRGFHKMGDGESVALKPLPHEDVWSVGPTTESQTSGDGSLGYDSRIKVVTEIRSDSRPRSEG